MVPNPRESSESEDSTFIDVEDHESPVPMFVQHTESILEEIDEMVVAFPQIYFDIKQNYALLCKENVARSAFEFVIFLQEEVEMEDIDDEPVVDIDSSDKKNTLAVVEYVEDLYAYYKKVEVMKSLIELKLSDPLIK